MIKRKDKRLADTHDYSGVNLWCVQRIIAGLKIKMIYALTFFRMGSKVVCPIYISEKEFDDCMNVLMIHEGDKSHYVYIKDFNRLMFNKTKSNNKKWFCVRCSQCFGSESILEKHKENCLVINGEQRVKLSGGSVSFKNY